MVRHWCENLYKLFLRGLKVCKHYILRGHIENHGKVVKKLYYFLEYINKFVIYVKVEKIKKNS